MTTAKKSFVLYFDNYSCIRDLSDEQRGILLSALFEYAIAAAEEQVKPDTILKRFPNMDGVTRMAYCFIADTVSRDTEKWHQKHKNYSKAAEARQQERRSREDMIAELRKPLSMG